MALGGIMALTAYNFTIEQGDDLSFTITVKDDLGAPMNVSAFRMDVKKNKSDLRPIWSFNTADTTVEIDPDLDESGPPEDDTGGDADVSTNVVTITIDRDFTFIPAVRVGGVFIYDGFAEFADGTRRKVITGTITVNESVTKWSD
jgi:hypothetical protein